MLRSHRRLALTLTLALTVAVLGCGVSPDARTSSGDRQAVPTSDTAELSRSAQQDAARQRRAQRLLTNACSYTSRGIPECGTFVGAAFGGNHDPSDWEDSMGHRLGVRRTYWGPEDVDAAVGSARSDLARQRLPWMSFKLPYSWERMRSGEGDQWARSLARKLSVLDGPVWLALHHEPEGDGDITAWTATQTRLAPLVRREAPNVAYSIILTGWNQLYGDSRYELDAIWPDTRIDLVGFDVFNKYGVEKNGTSYKKDTEFRNKYFPRFHAFASKHDLAWGLAETGYTDESAEAYPEWIQSTYRALVENGGVVFSYFNSTFNATGSWHLSGDKERMFAKLLRDSPTL